VASIDLRDVRKLFPGGHVALQNVTLTIADGERVALVGPSGSGKSTLLRIIAGLDRPTAGRVLVGGRDVTDVPPEQRDLAMVFQSYALYPHKTVRENLAFGLRVRRVPRADVERRVTATAESLGILPLLDRLPAQLSGGQRQRVAVGRAIVREPQAFLFDEPLSNLDPALRRDTRAELVDLHARLAATMVYVTHDQEEAMTLGQRVAVLRDGAIEQVAAPADLYDAPATTFVAQFIGSPAMTLLNAAAAPLAPPAGAALVGIRPHDIRLDAAGGAGWQGTVQYVEPLGYAQIARLETTVGHVTAVAPPQPPLRVGDRFSIAVDSRRLHFFGADGRRVVSR
jgi:ABC-type sugar transport system ATPase subunit